MLSGLKCMATAGLDLLKAAAGSDLLEAALLLGFLLERGSYG